MKILPPPASALATAAMLSVQLGSALSTHLFAALTPAGTAFLRLSAAAVILLVWVRPSTRSISRPVLLTTVALGAVTGLLMLMFIEAIARIHWEPRWRSSF